LEPNEKFDITVKSVDTPDEFGWTVNENGITGGGGTITQIGDGSGVGDGFRFEVNFGLGSLPIGEATWQVRVIKEIEGESEQVSLRSEQRQIFRIE
jgi:hypothetical protein